MRSQDVARKIEPPCVGEIGFELHAIVASATGKPGKQGRLVGDHDALEVGRGRDEIAKQAIGSVPELLRDQQNPAWSAMC